MISDDTSGCTHSELLIVAHSLVAVATMGCLGTNRVLHSIRSLRTVPPPIPSFSRVEAKSDILASVSSELANLISLERT